MINLLPYNPKKLINRMWRMRVVVVILLALMVLLIISGFLFFPTLLAVNNRYALTQSQLQKLESRDNFFNDVDLTELDRTSQLLEKKLLAPTGNDPIYYMNQIQAVTPLTVSISRYSVGDTASPVLQIYGTSTSRNTLEAFVKTLQGLPSVLSVDSPITNYVKNTNATFTITVTFKRV